MKMMMMHHHLGASAGGLRSEANTARLRDWEFYCRDLTSLCLRLCTLVKVTESSKWSCNFMFNHLGQPRMPPPGGIRHGWHMPPPGGICHGWRMPVPTPRDFGDRGSETCDTEALLDFDFYNVYHFFSCCWISLISSSDEHTPVLRNLGTVCCEPHGKRPAQIARMRDSRAGAGQAAVLARGLRRRIQNGHPVVLP